MSASEPKEGDEMPGESSVSKCGKSVADKLAKLKLLKQKKQESEKLNRQELIKDFKNQKVKSLNLKQIEPKKLNAELKQQKLDCIEKGEDFERKKNWDWTIEDCEKWERKQNLLKINESTSGYQNFIKLGESSYYKEISNLAIDKEEYERQKKELMQKYNITNEKDLKKVIHFNNKPDKATTKSLVKTIEEANNRRMKRRRNKAEEDEVTSYINDKNKQFNLKLNRQYNE